MNPMESDFLGLKDKVVLITGASSGLGANVAAALAAHGARLALTGRNEEGLKKTVRECLYTGIAESKIFTIVGDLTKAEDCKKIADESAAYFGRIDALINNAGIVKTGTFEQCTVEALDEVMDTNVRAMFWMTKCVLPWLQGSKGCIVNISSFTGQRPVHDYFAYCMSKTAVEQFTKNLALEMGQIGIRVNSICPGIMRDTNLWLRPGMLLHKNPLLGGFVLKKIGSMYPLMRPSTSDEVMPAVLFMISEKCSSFITGSSLLIDGGKALTSEQA